MKSDEQYNHPTVSVIIPVYNDAEHLPRAIASVQAQTLKDVEILCIDDGSTDDTAATIQKLSSNDSRIRYLSKSHKYSS